MQFRRIYIKPWSNIIHTPKLDIAQVSRNMNINMNVNNSPSI